MSGKHKYILDAAMVILIMTLYSKNVISLTYHEVTGLILCGFFVIHILFNRKWIAGVGTKLFSGKITTKARVTCLVDLLLLFSWIGVAVTGILISKKIFSFHVQGLTPFHFFFAAMGLILAGIHLGLHADYIKAAVRRIPEISRLKKPVTTILLVLLLGLGCVSAVSLGMGRWLSAPFTTSSMQHAGPSEHGGSGEMAKPEGGAEGAGESPANVAEGADAQAAEDAGEKTGTEAAQGAAASAFLQG